MVKKPHAHRQNEDLRAAAGRVLASDALGSGRVLPELFRYLVDRALEDEVPKELDIAMDVFGKDAQYRDAGDAQIRVWIYRLRSQLDRYYAGAGRDDPFRIQIPKGTYKIETSQSRSDSDSPRREARRQLALAGGAIVLAAALGTAGWSLLRRDVTSAEAPLVANSIWSGLASSDLPVIVVIGDHFFFGERDSPIRIRDIRINSEAELLESTEHRRNPELMFETLSYMPKSAVFGLPEILPRVSASTPNYAMKLASELTPDDLRVADIVYVGFIRSMGVLRDYYLTKSNFVLESPYLEIEHPETERVFSRSGSLPQSNTDYGLFARFAGPAGNQVLVFSGIGDVGVMATVHALSSPEGIDQIDELVETAALGAAGDWEVLLAVDGHSRTDLDFRLVDLLPMDRPRRHHSAQASLPAK